MSLPLSPPPSRSSSQASITRSNSESSCKPEEISPVSSAGSFASARMTKLSSTPSQAPQPHVKAIPPPILAVKPPITGISFLEDPSANASSVRSFFSPCSSDEEEEEDNEEEEEEEEAMPRVPRSGRRRVGKYQRLWAKQPPKTPFPFGLRATAKEVEDEDEGEAQGPRLQRRPSLASPTFGNTAASTAASTPALRPSETEPWSATSTVPPFAPTPPAWQSTFSVSVPQTPTAPAPIPNARSDAVNSLLSYDAELLAVQTRLFQTRSIFPLSVSEDLSTLQTLLAENEKSFLSSLQTMYSITLSHLLQPNTAKEQRDRLMVQTQKAHLRRVGPAEVAALHRQLAAAEEEMSRLEQGILERRLERELEALEKRAKGELKIVERLRRRMKREQSSSEEEESEPETEYHLTSEQPLGSPALPHLPVLSPDEETFIAAISRPTSPVKFAAQKSPRMSLPSLITNNKQQTPPQRPLFSPKLPPEFMTLPQLITTSPTPTSPGYSPLPGRYRRATFGSPLSTFVSMSALDTPSSGSHNSLPASPYVMSPLEITPEQKDEEAQTILAGGEVAPADVEPEQEEKKSGQEAEKEKAEKDEKKEEKETDEKDEKKENDLEKGNDLETEKATDEKDDKKADHETEEKEKDEKDEKKNEKDDDMRPGSPVLCTRVNGVEMTMI